MGFIGGVINRTGIGGPETSGPQEAIPYYPPPGGGPPRLIQSNRSTFDDFLSSVGGNENIIPFIIILAIVAIVAIVALRS